MYEYLESFCAIVDICIYTYANKLVPERTYIIGQVYIKQIPREVFLFVDLSVKIKYKANGKDTFNDKALKTADVHNDRI